MLTKEIERLEHEKGNKIEHNQALKGFSEAMLSAASNLSVLINNELPDIEYTNQWREAINKASDTIGYFQNILDDIERNQQTIC